MTDRADVFRIALTGDFLDESGPVAYGDIGLGLLDEPSHVRLALPHGPGPDARTIPATGRGSTRWRSRPEHIRGVDGLVVLRPWVKRSTFAEGAGDLVVIGRSGAGYDKIDLAACTEHGVAVFNAPDGPEPLDGFVGPAVHAGPGQAAARAGADRAAGPLGPAGRR